MRTGIILTWLVAASGCGAGDPLGPRLFGALNERAGCADVTLYAVDGDDALMVRFQTSGAVAKARDAGMETVRVFELPDSAVTLTLEQGERLSNLVCNDVLTDPGPVVHRTWTASAGSATLRVRPAVSGTTAQADLLLEHVEFTSGGDEPLTLGRLQWEAVLVGWYPG